MKRPLFFFALFIVTLTLSALPPAEKASPGTTVTVYYFHRQIRCHTCRTAEAMAFAALREHFPEQIEKGNLVLRSVTVDGKAEEKALAREYGAFGPSLFLKVTRGNRIEKISLDKMWDALRKGIPIYQTYVVESVKKVLQ